MSTQLNNVFIRINNEQIAYTADSLKFSLGKGEASMRSATAGGDQVDVIFSQDLSSLVGKVSFAMPATEENIAYVRKTKNNRNQNVVELVGATGSSFTVTFGGMAIVNDPEYNLSSDGNIDLEFHGNPAV